MWYAVKNHLCFKVWTFKRTPQVKHILTILVSNLIYIHRIVVHDHLNLKPPCQMVKTGKSCKIEPLLFCSSL